MKKGKKPIIDGGRAPRLRRELSSLECSCNGTICLFSNGWVMKSENKDRPEQTRNRMGKLKWLIRNIPRGGAMALEIVKDRVK